MEERGLVTYRGGGRAHVTDEKREKKGASSATAAAEEWRVRRQEEEEGGRGSLFKGGGRLLGSSHDFHDLGHVEGNRRSCLTVAATKIPTTSANAATGTEDRGSEPEASRPSQVVGCQTDRTVRRHP